MSLVWVWHRPARGHMGLEPEVCSGNTRNGRSAAVIMADPRPKGSARDYTWAARHQLTLGCFPASGMQPMSNLLG